MKLNYILPINWKLLKLNEISRKISLNNIKLKQKEYLHYGTIPVIDQGSELIGDY